MSRLAGLPSPDLTFLRTFMAVYRCGSLSTAAKTLGITQPTTSLQLQALESQLGRRLFERHARGVRPTQAGDDLAAQIGSHLDALGEVVDSLSPRQPGQSRTLYLGGPPDLLASRIVPWLGPRLDDYRLVVRLGDEKALFKLLLSGELDMVVSTSKASGAVCRRFHQAEFLLVGCASRWGQSLSLPPEERAAKIADGPFVTFTSEAPVLREVLRRGFGIPLTRPPAVVLPDFRGLMALIEAGVGLGILPDYLASKGLASKSLVELAPPHARPQVDAYLCARRGVAEGEAFGRVFGLIS